MYFSNGTEGADWQDENCTNCLHYGDCTVICAHFAYNYEQCYDEKIKNLLW